MVTKIKKELTIALIIIILMSLFLLSDVPNLAYIMMGVGILSIFYLNYDKILEAFKN